MASRPPSCSSSRFPSRLVSCRRAASFVSSRGAERSLRGVICRLTYIVIALASSRLVRLVLRSVGRDGLAFLSHVVGRRVSICRLGSLLTQFAFVSSPFVVVSVGRFWAWVCGEIELTKTARFIAFRLRLIRLVRACVVSDENRPRSNGSETRDRCRFVRTPGLSYARRSFPPIDLLARLFPRPGGRGSI